jgi:hypothetical protein
LPLKKAREKGIKYTGFRDGVKEPEQISGCAGDNYK